MSGILKVGGSELINDNGGSGALQWGSGLPSGSIVQVQFHQFGSPTDEAGAMTSLAHNVDYVVQTSGNTSGGGETGVVDTTITPRITGSTIWLQAHWFGELNIDATHDSMFFFWRSVGSTHTKLASAVSGGSPTVGEIGISAASRTYFSEHVGGTAEVLNMQYFDSHGVSAGTSVIYKLGFTTASSTMDNLATNRASGNDEEVGVTSLCAIELAP